MPKCRWRADSAFKVVRARTPILLLSDRLRPSARRVVGRLKGSPRRSLRSSGSSISSFYLCWTVIKHESFAVRKATGRSLPAEEPPDGDGWAVTCTDERAERYEQLRLGAEAMAGLKPQEIRCLVLKAEGLSYREICAATGWSYTNVKRSVCGAWPTEKPVGAHAASALSGAACPS
jgi:DNA-directed RNA polymerase specialized sigma24 family protein